MVAYRVLAADIKSLLISGNEAQSPDFCHSMTIFGIFQAVRFGTSLLINDSYFSLNFSPVYVLLHAIKDFLITVTI